MSFLTKRVALTAGTALVVAIGIANFPTLRQPARANPPRQQKVAAKQGVTPPPPQN